MSQDLLSLLPNACDEELHNEKNMYAGVYVYMYPKTSINIYYDRAARLPAVVILACLVFSVVVIWCFPK